MKTRIDALLGYGEKLEYQIPKLPPERQERIMELTMKKIKTQEQTKRNTRPARIVLIAAAAAVLLCGSAFAAYTTGFFGFAEIFGQKHDVVAEDVVSFGEDTDVQLTQPSYTEEEQKMIEEGTMMVPDQGILSEDSIGASTEDYRFTLEEMITTPDTLMAVVRVDALTDAAKGELSGGDLYPVFLLAKNNTEDGRDRELINGGMSWDILSQEEGTMYLLLQNSGGEFLEGDKILFHHQTENANVDLFEVPVTHLMDAEVTVELDASAYEGKGYQFDSVTISPISLVAKGSFTVSPDQSVPVIVVTLKDGTSFELANIQNGFAYMPYGTYGSLTFAGTAGHHEMPEGPFIRYSWTFSQVVDLNEIESITVDGVVYTLNQ